MAGAKKVIRDGGLKVKNQDGYVFIHDGKTIRRWRYHQAGL